MATRDLFVEVLLWYNVISLGIWAGGTVYQMLVIVPIWNASLPESLQAFMGTGYKKTIWNFFGPVTQITRALPLFLLVALTWTYVPLRPWVAACGATLVIGLVLTRAVIYPINSVLFFGPGGDLTPQAVRTLARRWIFLDRVRFAIMAGGYLCLLRAFSLPLHVH